MISWIPVILIAVIIICVVLYFLQDYFIFHPEKLPSNFKFRYNRPFKEMFFDVERNVRIHGLYFTVENAKGVILYFHGNTRSVKGWARFSRDFTRYGYEVVMTDYRGFGKSSGKRTEANMMKDAQFVYLKLAEKFGDEKMIVYGRSIGSGFAAKVASLNLPRFCILDAPYYSFLSISQRYVPLLPLPYLLKYPIRTDLYMQHVRCHTYILHGTKDRLIPISSSERLAGHCTGPHHLIAH